MNYHQYYPTDFLNGEGTRAVLFVSGCQHECRGCYNQSTWSPSSGNPFTKEMEDRIIRDLQDTEVRRDGLTLSGGDPLHEQNLDTLLNLINRVREECPGKTIWIWTGFYLEELLNDKERMALVDKADVLVDGRFVQALYEPSLQWRGSSNQTVYRIESPGKYSILVGTGDYYSSGKHGTEGRIPITVRS